MIKRIRFFYGSRPGGLLVRRGMMHIRRVLTLAVAMAAFTGTPVLVAQQDEQESRRDQERRSQQEQRDIQALVQMVDAVAEGTEPAPTDIGLQWEAGYFIRGADGTTYVPFTLAIDRGTLPAPGLIPPTTVSTTTTTTTSSGQTSTTDSTSTVSMSTPGPDVALYVRAVSKDAAPEPDADVAYAWDNVNFLEVAPDGKVERAMALAPGEYDVFIAIKEQSPLEPQRDQPPTKAGLLRRDLTVPDFGGSDLTISSVFIGTIEPLTTPMTPEEQQENPYTFGTMRVMPSTNLNKSGELQVLFWIYGTEQTNDKPDVLIEYNFHQMTAEGEKYFNKTAPQVLNASTLPPQWDIAAGHQLPGSIAIPLASFPVGEYRLEITLTDNVSGRTLTHNANFTVEA